jgi:hypothetical protein
MRCLIVSAICAWVAMLASIGIAAWLWRSYDLRPHAGWATISLLLVIGSTIWLTCATIASLNRREGRLASAGLWLLGTTPLLWFFAFATTLYIDANGRQPLVLDTPLRLAAAWSCSFFDLEARLRYPRWTLGKQTVLIDAGQSPAPESLVSQMDEHIASMTNLLEQQPLSTQVAWVRGSIFGMEGRANGSWAICNADGSADQLDRLDRHEVAHSMITMLAGPDQDPPAVLVEGWAESQSAVRDDHIRHLAQQKREGNTYALSELIAPGWYMRSNGPVYSHGGPLVHYLIERFGAPKFFELYRDVRRPTFTADCERILGVSWDQLDADFWRWVATEDEKLPAPIAVAADAKNWSLEFSDGVSEQDWKILTDACLAAKRSRKLLPTDVAIDVHWTWTRIDHKRSPDPVVNPSQLVADFEGDKFWIYTNEGSESCLISDGDRCASLTRYSTGHVAGWVGGPEARGRIAYEAAELIDMYRGALGRDASSFLPINEYVSPGDYRVERLVPPKGNDGVWKVVLHIKFKDGDSNRYELTIDPARNWQVTDYTCTGSPESHTNETAKFERFGGVWFAAASKYEADYTAEQEYVTSEASVRKLNRYERLALRKRVEQMAKLQPTKPWHRLRQLLTALVYGWPLAGIALVAISRRYAVSSDATPTATIAPMIGPTTGIQA